MQSEQDDRERERHMGEENATKQLTPQTPTIHQTKFWKYRETFSILSMLSSKKAKHKDKTAPTKTKPQTARRIIG